VLCDVVNELERKRVAAARGIDNILRVELTPARRGERR
jgi:hypothetical protein